MKVERKTRSFSFRLLVRLSTTKVLFVGTQYSNQIALLSKTSWISMAIRFSQLTRTTATYHPASWGFWAFLGPSEIGLSSVFSMASPPSPAWVGGNCWPVFLFSILSISSRFLILISATLNKRHRYLWAKLVIFIVIEGLMRNYFSSAGRYFFRICRTFV